MKEKSKESNFIKHRVRIKIDGFKPEKLISIAIAKGVDLHNISYRDETEVFMTVSAEDYKILKKAAKSKYRMEVIHEAGSQPTVKKLLKHKLALLGIIIFILVCIEQSLFIKEVNILGCKSIPETTIRETLKEEGIYEGGLKKIDCESAERKLFTDFDTIVWARIAYEGQYVQVEISETKRSKAKEVPKDTPCNIVADKDCYIERILSYKGRSIVAPDDFVKKGKILITGTLPIERPTYEVKPEDSTEDYVHASGKIQARVPYHYSFYMEGGTTKSEANDQLMKWTERNVPESAQILNKSLYFDEKKNIIRVYGTIETRQLVGVEKEIKIDEFDRGNEKDSN